MMKLTAVLLLLIANPCLAQSDTSLIYLNTASTITTKDSAHSVMKIYRENNSWHGKEYYLKNGILKSEGDFENNSIDKPVGSFKNFNEKGQLDHIVSYVNYKQTEVTYYYKNGNKRSWLIMNGDQVKQQKGWDESGKEIKGYIVMQPATYKGGINGWTKYLQKNLDADAAVRAGMPAGDYTVVVSFKVSKIGYTTEVKVVSVSAPCKACEQEAVNAIINSREWQPAILQNEPVDYRHRQGITFSVSQPAKKN